MGIMLMTTPSSDIDWNRRDGPDSGKEPTFPMVPASIRAPEVEIVPCSKGLEKLARRLHWHMDRLNPSDGREWEDLTDSEREFYLICVDGLFEDREAILEALTLTDDNVVSGRAKIGK
jgi:hypothetical protein